jgi:hypothetical protein
MATIGGMIAARTRVTATCRVCGASRPADLKKLVAKLGTDGTLVDRHPPCWKPKCEGRILFIASPGRGTPARPCTTVAGQVAHWRRERDARDRIKALRNG